jgi:hypothetical protein
MSERTMVLVWAVLAFSSVPALAQSGEGKFAAPPEGFTS